MGPIFLDLTGLELSAEEKELLKHPQVGGIVFFARNYESPEQLAHLIEQIRANCSEPLLLTVDQEGGRVQRFLTGFTKLPSPGTIGKVFNKDPQLALKLAKLHGWLMASELLALGIDLSFSLVLDLNKEINEVIGERAFHKNPEVITQLAHASAQGINNAGMRTVGKHFPGHGSVTSDTHTHFTVDSRDYQMIESDDLIPFAQLSPQLDGIMASHIVYSAVDPLPCGFSTFWIQNILRKKLKFSGAVFTDDLSMQAVQTTGSISARVQLALQAGCDGILICNHRKNAITALEYLERSSQKNQNSRKHLQKLFPHRTLEASLLHLNPNWQTAVNLLSKLNELNNH